MRQEIVLPGSTFSADSLTVTVSAQQPCAIAHINICAQVQNPKHWQPLFGHMKIQHAPTGVGNAALAAAVP